MERAFPRAEAGWESFALSGASFEYLVCLTCFDSMRDSKDWSLAFHRLSEQLVE